MRLKMLKWRKKKSEGEYGEGTYKKWWREVKENSEEKQNGERK